MHVTTTTKGETEVTLAITATAEDLEPIKQLVLKKLARNLKIPGFRGGKVPLQLAEKHLDPSTLQTEFLDEAMTQLYAKATEQEHVRPVTQPQVNIKKFVPFTTLEFDVTTQVIGAVKVGNYKGLKAKTAKRSVTQKDVDTVLDSLQTRGSDRKEVKRAAKAGDEAIIDFKGVDAKKQPIEGGEGKSYPLVLGSNAFIPGFEDNVVGMKPGDEKSFTLTFPKEYGVKALATKKVTFTVTLQTLNELTKKKLDDAFAAGVGPFKTLDELKADIKKQLEQEAEQEYARTMQNELVEAVAAASEVAIPESLIDQQAVYELDELRRNLTYRGQTYEEFLQAEGVSEDDYKKDVVRPRAELQVKVGIVLSEIADKEQIAVTPEELEMQMQALKSQYKDPGMQAELDKPESRRDIASRMLSQKVVDYIVSQSK